MIYIILSFRIHNCKFSDFFARKIENFQNVDFKISTNSQSPSQERGGEDALGEIEMGKALAPPPHANLLAVLDVMQDEAHRGDGLRGRRRAPRRK